MLFIFGCNEKLAQKTCIIDSSETVYQNEQLQQYPIRVAYHMFVKPTKSLKRLSQAFFKHPSDFYINRIHWTVNTNATSITSIQTFSIFFMC